MQYRNHVLIFMFHSRCTFFVYKYEYRYIHIYTFLLKYIFLKIEYFYLYCFICIIYCITKTFFFQKFYIQMILLSDYLYK